MYFMQLQARRNLRGLSSFQAALALIGERRCLSFTIFGEKPIHWVSAPRDATLIGRPTPLGTLPVDGYLHVDSAVEVT